MNDELFRKVPEEAEVPTICDRCRSDITDWVVCAAGIVECERSRLMPAEFTHQWGRRPGGNGSK